MSEQGTEDETIGQYLEDFVPKADRNELENLAGKVANGLSTRRSFMTRATTLGMGAVAASTALTAMTVTVADKAFAQKHATIGRACRGEVSEQDRRRSGLRLR
jgi:hypothetical protein